MIKVHIDGIVDLETLDFTERHYRRQGQTAYMTLAQVGNSMVLEYEEGGILRTSIVKKIEEDDTVFNVTTMNTIYHFSKC